ncbi:RNA recognition motif domain [Phaffia rhodozyma]|uniref:RNA recognition motif domain n=1 Tax=Phaffia rhodozyma TaxID=264483 RepID=A0A0F7SPE8_PHARH|nr:RNA recognition motif domain [Phaffia rhodozyma]
MLDIPSLKVTELKAELDKAGVSYSKSSKKADLVALLQSHSASTPIVDESVVGGEPTPSTGFELELDVNGKIAPVSTLSIPPPAEVVPGCEPLAEASVEQPADEQPDIPVAPNPDEIPVPLTGEQEAAVKEAEELGAGSNGAEGASNAGIALNEVGSEPKAEEESKVEPKAEAEAENKKRSLDTEEEEEEIESVNKRARPDSPDTSIAVTTAAVQVIQPQEIDPSAEQPSNFIEGGHPPTRSLYITNLRRPLPDEALRSLLDPFGPIDHHAGYSGGDDESDGGWWLSPVKSHAFVSYMDAASAKRAYEGLQSLEGFPPEAIDPPALKVEYLSTGVIPSLVDQEEASWRGGRKKLNLIIRKESSVNQQGTDHWVFEYKSAGDVSLVGNRRPTGGIPNIGFRPPAGGGGPSAFRPSSAVRPVGPGSFDDRRSNASNRPPTGPRIPPTGPAGRAGPSHPSLNANVPTGPSGSTVRPTVGRSTNGHDSRPGWTAADRRREENFKSSRRDQRDRNLERNPRDLRDSRPSWDRDSRDSRDYRAPKRDGPWVGRNRDRSRSRSRSRDRDRERNRDRDRGNYGRSRGDSYRPTDDRR